MAASNWVSLGCAYKIVIDGTEVQVASLKGFECVFRNIVTVVTEFALLALFIMLLVGGFKYMTAGGDPKAIGAAQSTLTTAILGVFLLVVIWLILLFIQNFTGVPVTQFNIAT